MAPTWAVTTMETFRSLIRQSSCRNIQLVFRPVDKFGLSKGGSVVLIATNTRPFEQHQMIIPSLIATLGKPWMIKQRRLMIMTHEHDLSHAHSLLLSVSLSNTHAHYNLLSLSHTDIITHSLSHTHTLSLSHSLFLSQTDF